VTGKKRSTDLNVALVASRN